MSQLVADSSTLYLKTHNYHWNVTGPHFGALHPTVCDAMHRSSLGGGYGRRTHQGPCRTPGSLRGVLRAHRDGRGDQAFQEVGNAGFRPLFDYIRGQNQTGQSVAMIAPVLQHRDEDTLPSVTTETSPGRYVVSFVMPDGSTRQSLHDPGDQRVTLRPVPEQLAAATRSTWRWTAATYQLHLDKLLQAVRDGGLEPTNPASFARYDHPGHHGSGGATRSCCQ